MTGQLNYVGAGTDTGRAERDQFLQSGPFDAALKSAIRARGLGLERLHERLNQRGTPVSIATLSYWQSGRSQPERAESLAALQHLEDLLGVPPTSLARLLGPPRPRGRWLHTAPDSPDIAALWPYPEQIQLALGDVDTRWDDRLTRISQHDRLTVGRDRDERETVVRQVLRAEADGPDRWVVILHLDEHGHALPDLRPLRNCHVGRVVTHPEIGLLVAELLFDRPLRRGETVITEHALVAPPPGPTATNYERKFRLPAREYVVEVCFHPDALPGQVVQVTRTNGTEATKPVRLGAAHSVHGVVLNFGPGCYGFRWDWPAT